MKRPALLATLTFIILLALTGLVVWQQSQIVRENEDSELQNELTDIKERFTAVLNENITAANTLAILYRQNGGIEQFDAVARELLRDHKCIDLIGLTDKFVVTNVYPLAGNEVVLGRNLLDDTFRRAEILNALAKKEVKFTGPYKMINNRGTAIAGRVPLYINDEFKGFIIVVTRIATIRRFLEKIAKSDKKFVYQLSKLNPVTNKVEYFFHDSDLKRGTVRSVFIPEGRWHLHVAYSSGYKRPHSLITILILGILLSLSVSLFVYNKIVQKEKLEKIVAQKTHDLGERVKELSTIYHLNNILLDEQQGEAEVFSKLVNILPPGWQYVDACQAKISFEGNDYATAGYHQSALRQSVDFALADGRKGTIEVVYTRNVPQAAGGVFLNEEQALLNSIARSLEIYLNKLAQQKARIKIARDLEFALSLTRATIESTADGILVVDTSRKVSDYNSQFLKLWQIPESMLKDNDASAVLALVKQQLVQSEEFESKIEQLRTSPHAQEMDTLHFKDGRVFEWHSKPQKMGDEIVGRVWSFRDVTQQKHFEAEIKELNADLEKRVNERTKEVNKLNEELKVNVQNLETANKDLESFSYSVSHDLRAPLRAINGFAGMLESRLKNKDEDASKFLKVITDNAYKMNQLIEDLLQFSRTGRKELETEPLDMNALLAEVLADINIHEKNEHTELIVGNMLPANGDKALLKQVLVNLLSNAIKYSSKKEKPIVEVGSYAGDNENIYFVKDNGAGFDMKYYDKLFKVFQRVHSAEDFEGVGIGLAIVSRIITKHGGRVWAEAEENVGATFYFSLPANTAPLS